MISNHPLPLKMRKLRLCALGSLTSRVTCSQITQLVKGRTRSQEFLELECGCLFPLASLLSAACQTYPYHHNLFIPRFPRERFFLLHAGCWGHACGSHGLQPGQAGELQLRLEGQWRAGSAEGQTAAAAGTVPGQEFSPLPAQPGPWLRPQPWPPGHMGMGWL